MSEKSKGPRIVAPLSLAGALGIAAATAALGLLAQGQIRSAEADGCGSGCQLIDGGLMCGEEGTAPSTCACRAPGAPDNLCNMNCPAPGCFC